VSSGKCRILAIAEIPAQCLSNPDASLRKRVGDISLWLDYLIDRDTKKAGKKIRKIERKTLELFQAYNLVEAALAESRGRFWTQCRSVSH